MPQLEEVDLVPLPPKKRRSRHRTVLGKVSVPPTLATISELASASIGSGKSEPELDRRPVASHGTFRVKFSHRVGYGVDETRLAPGPAFTVRSSEVVRRTGENGYSDLPALPGLEGHGNNRNTFSSKAGLEKDTWYCTPKKEGCRKEVPWSLSTCSCGVFRCLKCDELNPSRMLKCWSCGLLKRPVIEQVLEVGAGSSEQLSGAPTRKFIFWKFGSLVTHVPKYSFVEQQIKDKEEIDEMESIAQVARLTEGGALVDNVLLSLNRVDDMGRRLAAELPERNWDFGFPVFLSALGVVKERLASLRRDGDIVDMLVKMRNLEHSVMMTNGAFEAMDGKIFDQYPMGCSIKSWGDRFKAWVEEFYSASDRIAELQKEEASRVMFPHLGLCNHVVYNGCCA